MLTPVLTVDFGTGMQMVAASAYAAKMHLPLESCSSMKCRPTIRTRATGKARYGLALKKKTGADSFGDFSTHQKAIEL